MIEKRRLKRIAGHLGSAWFSVKMALTETRKLFTPLRTETYGFHCSPYPHVGCPDRFLNRDICPTVKELGHCVEERRMERCRTTAS